MRKIVFDIETKNIFQDVGKADPTLLDIAVVGVYDSFTDDYICYEEHEFSKLWPIIEKADMLIGFNSDHFDIPLLDKYYPGKLSMIKSIDLLKEIRNSLGRRIGLGAIAEATLGIGKSANGLQAIKWWKDGLKEKVKEYCLQDVKVTKELYDFVRKNGFMKYKEGSVLKQFPIDASKWESESIAAITHTLPF